MGVLQNAELIYMKSKLVSFLLLDIDECSEENASEHPTGHASRASDLQRWVDLKAVSIPNTRLGRVVCFVLISYLRDTGDGRGSGC